MDAETASKVRAIINKQFDAEIAYKQSEVETINERIYLTKHVLNRLRVAIIAKYFATPDLDEDEGDSPLKGLGNCVHPTVRSYFAGKMFRPKEEEPVKATYDLPLKISQATLLKKEPVDKVSTVKQLQPVRFIVGNVSKYIGRDDPENRVTHLWMTYVRLHPNSSEKIEELVSKVRFFLHPSYAPHDVIDVTYPFHLKRKGWGEFSLRAQIHFTDPLNKPADVLHELKLDQLKRGIQTNGGETHLEVNLMVEKPAEAPPTGGPFAGAALVKQEVAELDEGRGDSLLQPPPRQPAALRSFEDRLKTEYPSTFIDLEAHGHDYCTSPLPSKAPILLVATGSPIPRDNPPGVRIMRGESLLKARPAPSQTTPTTQLVTPWLEAVQKWEQSLQTINFKQDLMTVVEALVGRLFTLVGDRLVGDLSYQLGSLEEFLSLPLAKQRAIEWFRASHIRRVLLANGFDATIRTRPILLHLRRHGFTPLHEETEMFAPESTKKFNSLTVADLPADLRQLAVPACRKRVETSREIDVLGSDSDDEAAPHEVQISTPLLRFVYDSMQEVLEECSLPEQKDELEDVLLTTLALTKCFAESLLRKSLAGAFERTESTFHVDGILPCDVHSAVKSTELFDFLSNDGLGMNMEQSENELNA